MLCYECKKPCHFKVECLQLKDKKKFFKMKSKNLMGTQEDLDSSKEEETGEEANLCIWSENYPFKEDSSDDEPSTSTFTLYPEDGPAREFLGLLINILVRFNGTGNHATWKELFKSFNLAQGCENLWNVFIDETFCPPVVSDGVRVVKQMAECSEEEGERCNAPFSRLVYEERINHVWRLNLLPQRGSIPS